MKIMINANDLRTIRFPSNTSFIFQNTLFCFPHVVDVQSVLISISWKAVESAPADVEVEIWGTTAIEPASEEMIRKSATGLMKHADFIKKHRRDVPRGFGCFFLQYL